MYTVTVVFRSNTDHVIVNIGGTDPDLGIPMWHEGSPIVGAHTQSEWEELVRPFVRRFARHMGVNDETLHGGRIAYTSPMLAVMEFDFDSPDWTSESESLGSCGCTDYHMSDCPTRNYESVEDPSDFEQRFYDYND